MPNDGYGTNSFFTPPPPGSALGDLAAALAAAAGAAGVGFNIADAVTGQTGARNPRFANVPGTAHLGALSKYTSRLLAQNMNTMPPTFREFLQSGGTARFPLTGADQFTPLEAVQLGLVSKKGEIPYYAPGEGVLTPEQLIFLKEQRRRKRRANAMLAQKQSGGGGGKKKDKVQLTIGVGTGPEER